MEKLFEMFPTLWPLLMSLIGLVLFIGALLKWNWVLRYSSSTEYVNRSRIFSRRTVVMAQGFGLILVGIVVTVALHL